MPTPCPYAVIPWTTGGYGDWHLLYDDQRAGWECQDGGLNPAGANGGYELEAEAEIYRDAATQEEWEEEPESKQEETENPLRIAEAATCRSPTRLKCPTEDGACDYGLADGTINQVALEQQDIVTDPLLNAWQDAGHYENTDECRFFFGLPARRQSGGAAAHLRGDALQPDAGRSQLLPQRRLQPLGRTAPLPRYPMRARRQPGAALHRS